jgi:hypothetical protein
LVSHVHSTLSQSTPPRSPTSTRGGTFSFSELPVGEGVTRSTKEEFAEVKLEVTGVGGGGAIVGGLDGKCKGRKGRG